MKLRIFIFLSIGVVVGGVIFLTPNFSAQAVRLAPGSGSIPYQEPLQPIPESATPNLSKNVNDSESSEGASAAGSGEKSSDPDTLQERTLVSDIPTPSPSHIDTTSADIGRPRNLVSLGIIILVVVIFIFYWRRRK